MLKFSDFLRTIYAPTFWYWTLKFLAFSSEIAASYPISVRQTSVLPRVFRKISFGFGLATDTLAFLANGSP